MEKLGVCDSGIGGLVVAMLASGLSIVGYRLYRGSAERSLWQ